MVNNVSTSASYVEVDKTPNEDYGQEFTKFHILNCSVPETDGDKVLVDVFDDGDAQEAIVVCC